MFEKNAYCEIFGKIKKNERVCIYGLGEIGKAIKDEILKQRKDVEVVFFIDTNKKGEFAGLNIISPFELKDCSSKYDKIIISSNTHRNDMYLVLRALGIEQEKIIKVPLDDILNSVKMKKIDKSKAIFNDTYEKDLYQTVGKLWLKVGSKNEHLEKTAKHFAKFKELIGENVPVEQYFEHVNKDAVKVAIDGGSFNGLHSLLFSIEFKNIEKIYAFEPNYKDFKMLSSAFDKPSKSNVMATLIENNPKIEMIEKGLWSKEEVLEFKDVARNRAASGICQAEPYYVDDVGDVVKIKTTSIDKLVQDKNINKVDFIKLDVENSEIKVIEGAKNTILKDRPQMAISIYHSSEHFFKIPLMMQEMLADYVFRFGHYTKNHCESVLYAIPKELYKG